MADGTYQQEETKPTAALRPLCGREDRHLLRVRDALRKMSGVSEVSPVMDN
jgi:hypothetical protein